jgi:beta-lactamase class A
VRQNLTTSTLLALLAGCAPDLGGASVGVADAGFSEEPSADAGDVHHLDRARDDAPVDEDWIALGALVQGLGAQLEEHTGGEVSVSVRRLSNGQEASYKGNELHISASSAKIFWTAAALHGVGVDAVAAHAVPVFEDSDNYEAGAIIDLVGTNAVNTFMWDVANMHDSALTSWSFGVTRIADNSPRRMGGNNYFTANDSVRFMTSLESEELLGSTESDALRGWMLLTPRAGFGGWSGTDIPSRARASYRHKAGWLPPGCCSSDPHTLVDVGAVDTQAGGSYVYALLLRYGDWDAQERAMTYASCSIYKAVARDGWVCSSL